MKTDEEIVYQIALSKIPNIGYKLAKNLLAYCGSAETVFKSSKKELVKVPGIGEINIKDIDNPRVINAAEKEWKYCQKHALEVLFYTDTNYPRRLKHFEMSPLVLYYNGSADFNADRMVGIVGTRKPTPRGIKICEHLVEDLKALDVVVISGLAYGIDSVAHRKSVECSVPTIGVLGHGLDQLYPAENRILAEKMLQNGGGLLSEFGHGTKPDRTNFPMRNRVIAGLCDAIIVVESKSSGGSIITAEMANEYNKDVLAVPGSPDDTYSKGCNSLIKRAKAHLIEEIADLKYIMRWEEKSKNKAIQTSLFVDLDLNEQAVVDTIRMSKEISIDELSYKHEMQTSAMSSLLLTLEFKGVIRSLPGQRYMIN